MEVTVHDKSITNEQKNEKRTITSPATSLGILRKQLAAHIGIERIGGFLFQYGWEMGVAGGKKSENSDKTLEELVIEGPLLHIKSGQITGIDHTCDITYNQDGEFSTLFGRGEWIGSYEVEQHLRFIGESDKPICHTLSGYASGFMSTVFDKPLLAKELTCIGAGDEQCKWVIKPQEEWEEDVEHDVEILNKTPIVKELEATYDNLVDQKQIVTKLSDFQKQLTKEVVNGQGLQTLANIAFTTIGLPVIIEGLNFEKLSSAGLSDEELKFIKSDTVDQIHYLKKQNEYPQSFREKTFHMNAYQRVVVPVLVQQEVLGYCSFIIHDVKKSNHEEIYLFLDHLSNATALILLKEKVAFESFERMKGNFLDQILDGKMEAAELLNKGRYVEIDFKQPYRLIVLDYKDEHTTLEEEFLYEEHALEATFKYFSKANIQVLAGHRKGKLVILLIESNHINPIIKEFYDYMTDKFKNHRLKIGVSNSQTGIEKAKETYEEAIIALRLAIRKQIVHFKDLGIVGILINSNNIEGIHTIAEQELKELYHMVDNKSDELFETLYFFLMNGGNLKNTSIDLSLSMSGLRHRIQKIEELLDKDLRDPDVANHLLLILKALIVLKKIDFFYVF